jgi:hypothetical protein
LNPRPSAEHHRQKLIERLYKSAKSQPDPEAIADRAMVAAAVRGSATRMPEGKPVRYGDLTDVQFAAEKRKYGL